MVTENDLCYQYNVEICPDGDHVSDNSQMLSKNCTLIVSKQCVHYLVGLKFKTTHIVLRRKK